MSHIEYIVFLLNDILASTTKERDGSSQIKNYHYKS